MGITDLLLRAHAHNCLAHARKVFVQQSRALPAPCANIISARGWVEYGVTFVSISCVLSPLSTGAVMEGESTSLRAEFQVFLDNPANFYNVVMERSGEHAQRGGLSRE